MLQAEVDSLRSQLGSGGRAGQSSTELQLQQMSAALSQSHRDREELMGYITKLSQQRMNEDNNGVSSINMDHSRNGGRFDSINNNSNSNNINNNNNIINNNNNGVGYLHQQISSNGTFTILFFFQFSVSLTSFQNPCNSIFT